MHKYLDTMGKGDMVMCIASYVVIYKWDQAQLLS